MTARKNSKDLIKKIGYEFKNKKYLEEALTHRSYSNEAEKTRRFNNEKLEFLGDAILNLITTEYIYDLYGKKTEGELAKLKSQIISEPVFSTIASDIKLGEYLYLSNAIPHVGNYTLVVDQQYHSSHPTDRLHGIQKLILIHSRHV